MASLENLLNKTYEIIDRIETSPLLDQKEILEATSHFEYLRSEGYEIKITSPDNRHYNIALYHNGEKAIAKRYETDRQDISPGQFPEYELGYN